MDELTVLEFVMIAWHGKEKWVGESFWLWPDKPEQIGPLVMRITDAVIRTGVAILEPMTKWRFKATGRLRTLRGPEAQAMRHYLNRVGGAELPPVSWTPAAGRWTLTERNTDNG